MKLLLAIVISMGVWMLICSHLAHSLARLYKLAPATTNEISAAYWIGGCLAITVTVVLVKVMG